MVEAHEVKKCGMQVVNVHGIFYRVIANSSL
jgi:hypothetical protein